MKFCTNCKLEKDYFQFNKSKRTLDGFHYVCIPCRKELRKIYKERREIILNFIGPIYPKTYKICNFCGILIHQNFLVKHKRNNIWYYRPKCIDCASIHRKNFYQENQEKLTRKAREEYHPKYREKSLKRKREYRQSEVGKNKIKEYESQEHVKIARRLRDRLRQALKRFCLLDMKNVKKSKTLEYLGCSMDFFIDYLKQNIPAGYVFEDLFDGKLEIDHKDAFCTFDLTKEENLYKVCHYTNLQLLPIEDHDAKTAKDKQKSIYRENLV